MKIVMLFLVVACSSSHDPLGAATGSGSTSAAGPSIRPAPREALPPNGAPCVLLPGFFDTVDAVKKAAGDCELRWGERPMALLECGTERKRVLARSVPGRRVIAVRCALIDEVK